MKDAFSAPALSLRTPCGAANVRPRQTFGDQESAHIAACRCKHGTQPTMVASLCAFGARWAGAWDALKAEPGSCHDLPQPRCRALRQPPFGFAFRLWPALWCIEPNEPINLPIGANRVAVDDFNLDRIDARRAIRITQGQASPRRQPSSQQNTQDCEEN
jgi:hypothetical protein